MKVLFLAKKKPLSEDAIELVKSHICNADIYKGNIGDAFPSEVLTKEYDYVISYISPWVVPGQILKNTKIAAINLHPGPPEYPGIGCTNFAIYNGEKQFGITVHHMAEKVDTGAIISVERFPVFDNDTVYALTQRCYAYIYTSFVKIFPSILAGDVLPECGEKWTRKPYTRKELNELCQLRKDMSEQEVNRRIKATTYPGMPGTYWVK